jgi:hypothetical protein
MTISYLGKCFPFQLTSNIIRSDFITLTSDNSSCTILQFLELSKFRNSLFHLPPPDDSLQMKQTVAEFWVKRNFLYLLCLYGIEHSLRFVYKNLPIRIAKKRYYKTVGRGVKIFTWCQNLLTHRDRNFTLETNYLNYTKHNFKSSQELHLQFFKKLTACKTYRVLYFRPRAS